MNRIHHARRIRGSEGILAELPGILLTLLASTSAEEARRITVLSSHPPGGAFPHEAHCGRHRLSNEKGAAMAPLIALAAIGLFVAGVIAGIIGVVSVAIRREEKNLTLTSGATDPMTQAGRQVNRVYVRAPRIVDRPGRRQRQLLQRPPDTALALQVPSPRCRYTYPEGRDPDAR